MIHDFIDENEREIINGLPFDPTENEVCREQLERDDAGMPFLQTHAEQMNGQFEAGFTLLRRYGDTNGKGRLQNLKFACGCMSRGSREESLITGRI